MSSVLDNPNVRKSALRLAVDQYHRLCRSGIISERTELLDGIVVSKMGKSPLHTWTVSFLADWLRQVAPAENTVRTEQPLTLSESEPEPDLSVVRGSRDDYRSSHPPTAELVVEVSISTEDIDREKKTIYAHANVAEYWIVMPQQRKVLVHRDADSADRRYADVVELTDKDAIFWSGATLTLADLFKD